MSLDYGLLAKALLAESPGIAGVQGRSDSKSKGSRGKAAVQQSVGIQGVTQGAIRPQYQPTKPRLSAEQQEPEQVRNGRSIARWAEVNPCYLSLDVGHRAADHGIMEWGPDLKERWATNKGH